MYENFYGLKSSPFQLSPDPFFMFSSEKSREALTSISYAISRRKGFVVMTGEVGTGKTLVLRCLFELWEHEQIPYAYFIGPRLSTVDFLGYITFELGIKAKESSKGNMLRALYSFLLAQFERGSTTVLVIDEAHQMPRSVLEEIRVLANFETAQQKLIQIVLAGQPELEKKLDSVELRSLKQRVAVRCQLEPLREDEVRQYIERRLEVAGVQPPTTIFPPRTISAIHRYSQGIPRLVNSICDQALISGYAQQQRVIPVEIISEVAGRFRLDRGPIVASVEKPFSPPLPDKSWLTLSDLTAPVAMAGDRDTASRNVNSSKETLARAAAAGKEGASQTVNLPGDSNSSRHNGKQVNPGNAEVRAAESVRHSENGDSQQSGHGRPAQAGSPIVAQAAAPAPVQPAPPISHLAPESPEPTSHPANVASGVEDSNALKRTMALASSETIESRSTALSELPARLDSRPRNNEGPSPTTPAKKEATSQLVNASFDTGEVRPAIPLRQSGSTDGLPSRNASVAPAAPPAFPKPAPAIISPSALVRREALSRAADLPVVSSSPKNAVRQATTEISEVRAARPIRQSSRREAWPAQMHRWLQPGLRLSILITVCALVPVALATGVFMANRQKGTAALHGAARKVQAASVAQAAAPARSGMIPSALQFAVATNEPAGPRSDFKSSKPADSRESNSASFQPNVVVGVLPKPVLKSRNVSGAAEPPAIVAGLGREADLGKEFLSPTPPQPPPVAVAGQLEPARLLSSPVPSYPPIARSQSTQGVVVINAEVNEQGRVIDMKFISGPALLRSAAMDAVRNWRYEPARLDGQPISTRVQVSVKFSLQ